MEFSAVFEVNFRKYRSKDKDSKRWTPFVFAGFAYFHASPQAHLNGHVVQPADPWDRRSRHHGPSGSDTYSVDNICIPFGVGFKVNAGRLDFQLGMGHATNLHRSTWTM